MKTILIFFRYIKNQENFIMKHFTQALVFVAIGLGTTSTTYAPEPTTVEKAKLLAKGTACSARCGIGPVNYSKMMSGNTKGLSKTQIKCMQGCLK